MESHAALADRPWDPHRQSGCTLPSRRSRPDHRGGLHDTRRRVRASARGGWTVENAPTIAYELKDAVISRGQIFTWRTYLQVGMEPAPVMASSMAPHYAQASMASSWYRLPLFRALVDDDLPRQLAVQSLAPPLSV